MTNQAVIAFAMFLLATFVVGSEGFTGAFRSGKRELVEGEKVGSFSPSFFV